MEQDYDRRNQEPATREDWAKAWKEFTSQVSTAVDLGLGAFEKGVDWAATKADASYDAASKAIGKVPAAVNKAAAEFVDFIAGSPSMARDIIAEAVTVMPGLGATKRYADAWKLYHDGVRGGNQEMVERARGDCLRACIAAAIDIAALSNTVLKPSMAPVAKFFLTTAALHALSKLPQVDSAVIAPIVEHALKHEKVRTMMDEILTGVKPPEAEAAATV